MKMKGTFHQMAAQLFYGKKPLESRLLPVILFFWRSVKIVLKMLRQIEKRK